MEKVQTYKASKVFFTSDTHFFHNNIINFCKRPFQDVEEMNEKLIENWNKVVSDDSTVFHLGDFAFGGITKWKEILGRLNGSINLILGNHDLSNTSIVSLKENFHSVSVQEKIIVGNQVILLSHYPLLCYAGIYNNLGIWALSGHVHLTPNKEFNTGKDIPRMEYMLPKQYDVGVDFNNYTPISFYDLKKKMDYQIANNVNLLHWLNE